MAVSKLGKALAIAERDRDHTRGRSKSKSVEWLSRVDVVDMLERLEIENITRSGHDELNFACPFPGHNSGDARPSGYMNDGSAEPGKATVWKCFAGDTRVITKVGTKPISELSGESHTILDMNGNWKPAEFQPFGQDEIVNLVVSRNGIEKTIRTTMTHRWFIATRFGKGLMAECETGDLAPGFVLWSVFPRMKPKTSKLGLSPFGVARGITFGDGHIQGKGAVANLCGDKDAQLRKWFPLSKTWDSQENVVRITDLPRYYKTELPALDESPSYLHGWLAGYFAADGDVAKDWCISLNSADRDHLEYVRDLCTVIGIGTSSISVYTRKIKLPQGRQPSSRARDQMYRIRIYGNDLTPEFFLIDEHRRRFETAEKAYERRRWTVKLVEPTGELEPVYCAFVPETHAFVLEDNILTGNCHGCGRAGNAISFVAEHEDISKQKATQWLRELYASGFRAPKGGIAEEFETRRKALERALNEDTELPTIPWAKYDKLFAIDWHSADADDKPMQYILNRGFTPKTLTAWRIGYDDISERLTIPVCNVDGDLVGVKGRTHKPKKQERNKYFIIGDSIGKPKRYGFLRYQKSRVLFGLDWHTDENKLVLVEGELDVIALWQMGIPAVSTGSSSVSDAQAVLLRDYADEVVIYFDLDSSGINAIAGYEREGGEWKPGLVERLTPFMRVSVIVKHDGDAAFYQEAKRAGEVVDLVRNAVPAHKLMLD